MLLYSGAPDGLESLRRVGLTPRSIGDLEELLADPDIDAVIIASSLSVRQRQLIRALQSECHVLCVHPADVTPDVAYEAALVQADTGRVLMPLLPMSLHPGLQFLRSLARSQPAPSLLEMEVWTADEVLLELSEANHKPAFLGWDALRAIGGEIGEIYAQSTSIEAASGQPIAITGRFVSGLLLQATFLPNQVESHWRLALVNAVGRASLEFTKGWPGPARLTWIERAAGRRRGKREPWLALLERSNKPSSTPRCEARSRPAGIGQPYQGRPRSSAGKTSCGSLELDDAARRSMERGRSSLLDLQETTEEATFKGTMTLVGCSLIWLAVIVLILSFWIPWLAIGIVPVFGVFLILQALRWALPEKKVERPS